MRCRDDHAGAAGRGSHFYGTVQRRLRPWGDLAESHGRVQYGDGESELARPTCGETVSVGKDGPGSDAGVPVATGASDPRQFQCHKRSESRG